MDTHTAVIIWGDGAVTSAVIDESAGSFSGAHAYATGGIYDILVTLSDDDSGAAEKQATALVTGARVKDGQLQVVGTQGNDRVDINQFGKKLYKVHADFLQDRCHFATFNVADVESIRILLGDGNDHATITDNIDLPVFIDGGAGNDHLNAGRGPAVLIGGEGNDKLIGSRANDRIFGGNGNDVILGDGGNDLLDGGAGNDVIFGSCGDDTILGGDGNDWIFGGRGNDVLDGGNGNDLLFGGPGNDILIGGTGHDTLDGGPGIDILIDDGSVRLGKSLRTANKKSHGLIDWHGSHWSSPSWVRQFVVDLGGDHRDPNSDIRVVISESVGQKLTGFGGPRRGSVG